MCISGTFLHSRCGEGISVDLFVAFERAIAALNTNTSQSLLRPPVAFTTHPVPTESAGPISCPADSDTTSCQSESRRTNAQSGHNLSLQRVKRFR